MSDPLLLIVAMGVVTLLTRVAGVFVVRLGSLSGRKKAILDLLPGTILSATVAPMATVGFSEFATAVTTMLVVLIFRNLTLGILAGAAMIALIRQFS